jgi:signal transduction histidine kinase
MRWPLARQILLPMVGILLLTALAASALSAWLAGVQVQRRLEGQLADVAQTLSASNFPLETNVLRQTRGLTGAEYVLADSAGRTIAATDDGLRPAVVDAKAERPGFDLSRPVAAAGQTYFQAVVTIDRRPVGGTLSSLHVFYPERAWREARWQATWPPLAIGGAASLLVGLAAYVVAARVTQPIGHLRLQVERIAQGDFQGMPTPARNDEVRDLAAAVNQLAQRLAQYEDQTRKSERLRTLGTLGGGIAHQIRNAATGCRIALDLHRRDCPMTAANGHGEEPLAVAARQLELIEAHVRRFLTLGRPAAAERSATDLAGVVEQAISLVGPMAEHAGASIQLVSPPEPIRVLADAESLVQLLVNLLVNAVQAAAGARVLAGGHAEQSESHVVVRLTHVRGDRCEIAVGDPGPGPTAAIQGRLFEPFATDKPGGTGLGLVVSRQIAEDHGGQIRWERRDERTWFIVELPENRARASG